MNKPFKNYAEFKVGESLLEFFVEAELLSESKAKKINSRASIITESNEDELAPLFEEKEVFTKVGHDGEPGGHPISWSHFSNVYTDPVSYRDNAAMLTALQYDVSKMNEGNIKNTPNRIMKKFISLGKADLGVPKNRLKNWGPNGRMRQEMEEAGLTLDDIYPGWYDDTPTGDEPDGEVAFASRDGVLPGKRNKKTRTVNLFNDLNSQNILPGELYADFTRIPKQNWNSFIKFWNRKRTSVKYDASLLGREWKKLFVFGYSIDQNLFFEIWYNTLDATFSVHDKHGTEIARRSPTMNEAIRKMFNSILQVSQNDVDYDRSALNLQVQKSLARAVAQGMAGDDRMRDLMDRERESGAKDRLRKRQERQAAQARQEKVKGSLRDIYRGLKSVPKNMAKDATRAANAASDFANAAKEKDNQRQPQNGSIGFDTAKDVTPTSDTERSEKVRDYENRLRGIESKKPRNRAGDPNLPDVIELGQDERKDRNAEKQKELDAAYKAYSNERKRASQDLELMTKPVDKKQSKVSKKEKIVKPKATKQTKTKNSVKSLFTFADAVKDEEDGFKPVRRQMTDAERRELEAEFYGDDFDDFPTDDDLVDRLSGLNESYQFMSLMEQEQISDEIATSIEDETRSAQYQARVDAVRNSALSSNYTTSAFKNAISSDLVDLYTETKAPKTGKLRWLEKRFMRGRPDLRILPTDKPAVFGRIKHAFLGSAYRADFIIGITLNDIVNYEIWYVTEPNPEYSWKDVLTSDIFNANTRVPKFISSFYVYDITGERLVRKYIPYYRNALQIVMQKIGAI